LPIYSTEPLGYHTNCCRRSSSPAAAALWQPAPLPHVPLTPPATHYTTTTTLPLPLDTINSRCLAAKAAAAASTAGSQPADVCKCHPHQQSAPPLHPPPLTPATTAATVAAVVGLWLAA
nr:hypothetical protein [Tanacetum cinerariifolium]